MVNIFKKVYNQLNRYPEKVEEKTQLYTNSMGLPKKTIEVMPENERELEAQLTSFKHRVATLVWFPLALLGLSHILSEADITGFISEILFTEIAPVVIFVYALYKILQIGIEVNEQQEDILLQYADSYEPEEEWTDVREVE